MDHPYVSRAVDPTSDPQRRCLAVTLAVVGPAQQKAGIFKTGSYFLANGLTERSLNVIFSIHAKSSTCIS